MGEFESPSQVDAQRLCGDSSGVGRALGGGRLAVHLGLVALKHGFAVIFLAGAVDCNLDSNFTALNLLAVHLAARLLLELLGSKSDEAETTTLAWFIASLQLLDHEAGDWAKGNLGGGGGVVLEELHEPVLLQVVRKVRDHDLGLGGNAVLGRSALLLDWSLRRLGRVNGHRTFGALGCGECLVGGVSKREDLARNVGRRAFSGSLALCAIGTTALSFSQYIVRSHCDE